jgi:lipoprotein-anchoring transpeptidase ErfK/SrfK
MGSPQLIVPQKRNVGGRGATVVLTNAARSVARIGLGALCGIALGSLIWGAVALVQSPSDEPSPLSPSLSAPRLQPLPDWPTTALLPTPHLGEPALRPVPAWVSRIVVPKGESLVAEADVARVPVYRSVHSIRPRMTLSNPNSDGAPLVFLVISTRKRRLRVLLPTRPNLSHGWITRGKVRLALDPYRIAVDLRRHKMIIWRDGKLVRRYPVGVGRRAVTPTPFGRYYITELLKQPNPGGPYGPYAFGISAHSNVLHEFAGGNGEIGIHGTNEPGRVGTDVSHGCIRVYNSVIARLAHELPLGTPVQIEP